MPDFIVEYESDDAIAESMGLTLAQFRGEEPFDPVIPEMVCGEDDAQIDHAEYLKRVIAYREEYASFRGEGSEDGYIKYNEEGIGFTSFQSYVIHQEMDY
jgi:hypothetical protein